VVRTFKIAGRYAGSCWAGVLDFVEPHQLVWGVRVPGGKEKHAGGVQDGFLRVLNHLQKVPAREGWRKDGRQPC